MFDELVLLFKGDNRSAVKALVGISEQSEKTKRNLKADADAEALSMDKVREHAGLLKEGLMGLAGVVGVGGLTFGIKDLVEGGMNLQAQQAQLATALHATGQEAGDTAARLNDLAESMSTHGGFATTQNLSALTSFVRETHSASEAQKLLALSTNIARGRNIDLASAQQAVARAYTGSVGKLQALLGPMVAAREAQVGLTVAHQKQIAAIEAQYAFMHGPLKSEYVQQAMIADHITAQQAALAQMTDKHTTAQQALALATQEFAGATGAFSKSTQGHMSNLDHAVSNLTENLGKGLLPTVNALLAIGGGVAAFLAHNKTEVMVLSLAVAGLGTAWAVVKGATIAATAAQEVWAATTKGATAVAYALSYAMDAVAASTALVDAAMVALPIVAVIAAIVLLVTHWKQVKQVAVDAWHWIQHAASDAFGWIKSHWPLLAGILLAPFTMGISLIVGLFHGQLLGGIMSVVHVIEGVFSTVYNAITFPFRKAFQFIEGGIHDIEHLFSGIGHFLHGLPVIGGLFHAGGPVPRYLASGGPSGTDVIPAWLGPGEGVVSAQGMGAIGGAQGLSAINSGMPGGFSGPLGGRVSISPSDAIFKVDSQVLGRAVVQWALNEGARGPTTLVGGSLMVGAPGITA